MDVTYTIAGGDGQTYGPVTLQELQAWIREGRVGAQTNVLRSDINTWYAASQFQELSFAGVATPPALPRQVNVAAQYPDLDKKIKGGAGWFFWIAGLSFINAIFVLAGSLWGFALTLWVAFFCAGLGTGIGGAAGYSIAMVLVSLICGMFVLFGIFARKNHSWAFIVGLVLYAGDTALYAMFQEWLSVALHAFGCFGIFVGLRANMELKKQIRS